MSYEHIYLLYWGVVLSVLFYYLSHFLHSKFLRVPAIRSTKAARLAVLELIKKQKGKKELILDVGSGYGGFLIDLSKSFPDARVFGFEISPFPYLISKINVFLFGSKNAQTRFQDFNKYDFSETDVIFLYLGKHINEELSPKLHKEIKSTAKLYTIEFPFPDDLWACEKEEIIKGTVESLMFEEKIYCYKKR